MESYLDFLAAASFWRPRLVVRSAWLQHAPFAFWLVTTLQPRTIVELGAHSGFSYFAFCQAVAEAELQARCFAIDTWQGDDHAGFYGEDVYAAVSAHNAENYAGFSSLVRSTFDAALPSFAPASIDLLHIDGRHRYDDVKHDFSSWQDRLAPGAVVLFHDTAVAGRGFGVERFFGELAPRHETFVFSHGNGLGVLGRDDAVHPNLRALFRAPAAVAGDVRTAYETLGRGVELAQRFRDRDPLWRTAARKPSMLRRVTRN